MALSGTFFLDRSNREKAVKTLNKALQELKEKKRGLYMFPEGTRSYAQKPMLLPFKKGAFHLAQQGGIPIIPIIVSNTSSLVNHKTKTFQSGEITIQVLEPMSTDNLKPEDVGAFTDRVREAMLIEVEKLGLSIPDRHPQAKDISSDDSDDYETVPNDADEVNGVTPKGSQERTSLLSKQTSDTL